MCLGAVVALSFSAAAVAATITGTEGDDRDGLPSGKIMGTPDNDTISALAGHDVIYGERGDDTISAGPGDDVVAGDHRCFTQTFSNGQTLTHCVENSSARGHDRIFGDEGNDRIDGEGGNDRLSGNAGNDRVRGYGGNDRVSGGADNDIVSGSQGRDFLTGAQGDDLLVGSSGNDELSGGSGRDRLLGASGNDIIRARDGQVDVVLCGSGRDRVEADDIDRLDLDCERVRRYKTR